jgi:SPP1 gp7 family putative phage head morphogenesis protein
LGFSIYNTEAVEKLIKEQPALLPSQLDEAKDLKWNQQKVSSAITQGIIQGESIPNIANRLKTVVGMDRSAAIRNARTATTGAENAGRVDSYVEAESKGIDMEQEWMAVLDMRTRSEHRQLDGQTCPVHGAFEIDGEKIRYPGDPTAPGYLVYNCRCRIVAKIKGIEYKDNRWSKLPEGMTYDEWKNYKQETKQTAKVSKKKAPATTEDANKELKNLLKTNYENHRILNNTSSVPIAKFGDDIPGFMTADYGKLSVETANTFNKALSNLMEEYDAPLTSVRVMTKMEYFASQHSFAYVYHDYTVDNATLVINPIKCKNLQDMTNRIIELADNGYSVAISAEKASEYVITHEFAHTVINMRDQLKDKTNWVNSDYDKIRKARKEIEPIYERYMAETESLTRTAKDNELKYLTSKDPKAMQEYADKSIKAYDDLGKVKLSDYSMTDIDEFMAESFTNEKIGIKSNPYSKEVKEVLDKYFRRSKK